MSRTITAMFNSRSEAEAAASQLRSETGVDARIVDQSTASSGSTGSGSSGGGSSGGFWADLKDLFVAEDDRPAYEEGVRRGHFLLTANVPEDQADRAYSLLDQSGPMDFDRSQEQWRSEGWSGGSDRSAMFGNERSAEHGNIVEEERIPVVDEQLRVGKREVERGGARVRSYIEETPVHESVNLREEHVHVERRPVDQRLTGDLDNDLLRERSIEMRETAEEAIIGKEARVTEEVVVQKTADQRTEEIDDSVRHTHVDVDEGLTETSGFDRDRR